MSNPSGNTTFPVVANRDLAVVRIVGPGVCRESGRFENVLRETERRGYGTLVIDLAECPRIDSTFAGAFLRLAEREPGHPRVFLAGAQGAVAELIDTLLLGDVLTSVNVPDQQGLQEVAVTDRDLAKSEIMELSLDGHERLAGLNEANARRFAALLSVMRAQVPAPAAPSAPAS